MCLHPRVELDAVVDTVLALLEKLEEEESVLVEAMCPPAQLPFPGERHLYQLEVGAWHGFLDFLLDLDLYLFTQEVPHPAEKWLCASVLWCVELRVIGPY